MRPAAFPNWSWHDFSGYSIGQEKPCDGSAREIHDAIGRATDHSLFNWVAQVYACHGWLTCDDGSGEIADFVYVRPDGTLELIHVKAAESSHTRRGVSAAAYEVVASQATKNLQYLDPQRLIGHLERPLTFAPASWTHGGRVGTRDEVIEALLARGASDPIQVTVVQPHLRRSKRESSLAHHQGSNADSSRLRLLETLLNSARASATGLGADLVVVADDN